jgi:hypothetical protein
MQNHLEEAVRACRCRCPSWVPLLFVMGCLNLLVTMAHAQFTLGTGRVVSVTPLDDGGCISQDLPPSGTEEWRIQQNHSYLIRLEGVTECSGDTIHVHLFNPFRDENDPEDCYRPKCLPATRVGDGAYQFTVTFDQIEAKSYFIRYCTNADCSSGGVLARRSDGGNAPSTLVLTHFFPGCIPRAGHDKICLPSCCRYLSFDDLDLGCNPDRIPDCTELVDRIRCDDPSGVCCNFQVLPDCQNGEDEPDPERGECWFRRKVTYHVLTFAELEVCTVEGYIRWQVDTEPPVIEPPDGGDLGCNPVHIPTCDEVLAQTTVTDNCLHEPPTVDCRYEDRRDGCIVTRTFTITATDKCGNTSTATVTYTWNEDTEPPVIEPPDGGDLGCNPVPPECPIIIQQTTVKDNCLHEPPTVDCRYEDRRDGCIVTRTFTITATDKCGNRSEATVVYTWNEDREPPVIEPPDGGDLGCNPDPPVCATVLAQTTVTDNCLHEPPTVDCRYEDRRDGCIVTRTFTITATDKCGNTSTATVTYTWNEDTEPPVIEPPDGGDLGCNPVPPECPIIIQQTTVKDNCLHEPPTVDCRYEDRRDGCIVTRTFTITATDKCGNTSTATVTYTWNEDTEPPVIEPPDGGDLGCNPDPPVCATVLAQTTVTDNCLHEPPTVDCRYEDRRDGCIVTRTFTITATDKCGNTSTATVTYTWNEDTEPPVIEPPDGGDLGCNPDPPVCATVLAQTTVTDNCLHEPPTVDCRYEDRRDGCIVTRTFTITATDKCGNTSTATVTYTWNEDTEPPVIEPPDGGDLGCNPVPPECPIIIQQTTVKDNCLHEPPTVDCRYEDRRDGCIVTRTFTITATDKCGNRSEATVVYTWNEDREPPVIEPPDGGDLGCNPDPPVCATVLAQTTVTDNCLHEPPTVDCRYEDRRDGCIVTRTFTITATDKCGNTSTATVTYTWNEDTEPPVVNNVPETDKLPCNTRPTCDLLIARHNIHAKDNCTHEPPTLHCEPGEVVDLGNCRFRQTFTFWAVDKCGNRSDDYQLVVFWKEDTEPPVLHNVPEDRDLGCNPTHIPDCDEIRSGVYATDNCDPDVRVTCTYRDIVIGCLRIRSFILAAADECGNVTTRKVVVSWTEDTTPPIVRCPDNITVQAQFPDCLVPVTWRAKAEDDCDPRPSVACNPPSGSFFGLGTTTVTCTATDRCGNSDSCQFTVTVLGYICGYKFRDDNGNGVWEPHLGEPPLAGWTIELRDQLGNVLQTTTTGPDGKFCFLGLTSPGTYVVCEVLQNGWVNTTPICRTVVLPRDCGKLSFFGNRPLTQQ